MSTLNPPRSPVSASTALGTLYLVPTPLDFGCDKTQLRPLHETLPDRTLATAARLSHWVTENARSTRAFLNRVNTTHPLQTVLQAQSLVELSRAIHKKGDHTPDKGHAEEAKNLLGPALAGHDMGLVSEAGMPAVADPGSSVVRAAHSLGIHVEALVGPVSLLLALASSGLNGQNFAFVGYVPQEAGARSERLRELEALTMRTGQTQLFIETPYRNQALMQAALSILKPHTHLAVACGLTLTHDKAGYIRQFSAPIQTWRRTPPKLDFELPAVFMLGV